MQYSYLTVVALPFLLYSCGGNEATRAEDMPTPEEVMTSAGEPMIEGNGEWTDLMEGDIADNWHTYGEDAPGAAWKVDDEGALYLDTSNKGEHGVVGGGDLVTNESYANYELELDWKIGECGNSGLIYNVIEHDTLPYPWLSGPEMQILDNSCHPDAKIVTHRAGDLYDMITGEPENVKPAGEWNSIRLVVKDGYVEHWQNGERIVTYTGKGEPWKAMIADSKFKDYPTFGSSTSGKISLQDHGDPVWFRNIRIRELSSK
ncbi:DUF1080 domain-containing protein [Lewinella sp. JB7]|uniref:3-keto-disaccharide hydrolase n=1 Tax=Lewinella sp. JB7 TaxID=2962887 RepID=UPI0020C93EC6|nr:DUF1080 domain-containing protein [Lewinella sp. JB7]MCP9236253.1 DUF1080 domain-containing protein [Lewinella sp. JB7]